MAIQRCPIFTCKSYNQDTNIHTFVSPTTNQTIDVWILPNTALHHYVMSMCCIDIVTIGFIITQVKQCNDTDITIYLKDGQIQDDEIQNMIDYVNIGPTDHITIKNYI